MNTPSDTLPVDLSQRASGVLLHITSLPSPYGIGDLGDSAYRFADALADAGQRYWQLLPVNPSLPAADESPYFSSSALAGNPLLIDLDALACDGLLTADELNGAALPATDSVDFAAVRQRKLALLDLAQRRFRDRGGDADYAAFLVAQSHWLDDHALYLALRDYYSKDWIDWPQALRRRETQALLVATEMHAEAITREQVLQYFFARQWQRLRAYCRSLGVSLFGDMPIYVAYESVDVWANPDIFQLDKEQRPTRVSGVPPDYFSETGQLWNNPVYDWDALQASDFLWWQRRIANNLEYFDLLRIDHFRGLVQYWAVPAGAETAIDGCWYAAPTQALFDSLHASLGPLPVVVEDLGTITPDVVHIRDSLGFPGMVVLHFAFGNDDPHNPHRPENHAEHAIAYLGTHDNNTTLGWLDSEIDEAASQRLRSALRPEWENDRVFSLLEFLQQSRAELCIVSAQDLLALPEAARMNDPSIRGHNWQWRLTPAQFDQIPWQRLRATSQAAGRCVAM